MKKLSLKELKVKSFVTQLSDGKVQTVKGGRTQAGVCNGTDIEIQTGGGSGQNYSLACDSLRVCGTNG